MEMHTYVRNILFVTFCLLIFACNEGSRNNNAPFDFQKSIIPVKKILPSKDTIYLIFEGNFNYDTVRIYLDYQVYITLYLITEPSTGLAKELFIPNLKRYSIIGFKVNGNELKSIRLNYDQNILRIGYAKPKINLSFYDSFQKYY